MEMMLFPGAEIILPSPSQGYKCDMRDWEGCKKCRWLKQREGERKYYYIKEKETDDLISCNIPQILLPFMDPNEKRRTLMIISMCFFFGLRPRIIMEIKIHEIRDILAFISSSLTNNVLFFFFGLRPRIAMVIEILVIRDVLAVISRSIIMWVNKVLC